MHKKEINNPFGKRDNHMLVNPTSGGGGAKSDEFDETDEIEEFVEFASLRGA